MESIKRNSPCNRRAVQPANTTHRTQVGIFIIHLFIAWTVLCTIRLHTEISHSVQLPQKYTKNRRKKQQLGGILTTLPARRNCCYKTHKRDRKNLWCGERKPESQVRCQRQATQNCSKHNKQWKLWRWRRHLRNALVDTLVFAPNAWPKLGVCPVAGRAQLTRQRSSIARAD